MTALIKVTMLAALGASIACQLQASPAVSKATKRPTSKAASTDRKLLSRKVASLKDLSPQQKLVTDYFRCFETSDLTAAITCAESFLAKEAGAKPISEFERNRMATWLLGSNFELKSFADCGERKFRQARAFPLATSMAVCAVGGYGTVQTPIVFFLSVDKKGRYKIRSIFF